MSNNTPKSPLENLKEMLGFGKKAQQAQAVRQQTQQTLTDNGPKGPLDTIKGWFEWLGKPLPNQGEHAGVPDEDREEKVYPFRHFWDKLLKQITQGDKGNESIKQAKQLTIFSLATTLSEVYSSNNEQIAGQFCAKSGIGNINLIPNSHLITDRRIDGRGVPQGSALENLFIEAVKKFLPNPEKVVDYIKRNDLNFKEIIAFAFEQTGYEKNQKGRKDVREKIIEMIKYFCDQLEGNAELKALLEEIYAKILDNRKTLYHTESDKPEFKKKLEDSKKAVKAEFEARAPHAKIALEQLYRLKSLNGKQVFRLMNPAGNPQLQQERETFFETFGVDVNRLMQDFFEGEVRPKIESAKQNGNWPADLESKALPDENDAREWCRFLINDMLGKKIAQIINLDTKGFSEALKQAADLHIQRICPIPESTKAGSFDGLVDKLVAAPNIDGARYIAIAIASRNRYTQLEESQQGLWQELNKITSVPQNQRGKLKDVIMKIAKILKAKPEYENVEGTFNRLCHAILGHYVFQNTKKQRQGEKTDKEYADMCIESMDQGGEGFNKDYLYNIPVADKEKINFDDFDRDGSATFSLERLLEIYAEKLSDPALVDIAHEIEHDIIIPILTESGINIPAGKAYSADDPMYINESDFELAKKMGDGLRGLKKAKLGHIPKDEEEKKPEQKEGEKGYEISDKDKKGDEAFAKSANTLIQEYTKKKDKKEVGEDAKKRF